MWHWPGEENLLGHFQDSSPGLSAISCLSAQHPPETVLVQNILRESGLIYSTVFCKKVLLSHFNERTLSHRVEVNLHNVTQVLNDRIHYSSPNFSQSKALFCLRLNENLSKEVLSSSHLDTQGQCSSLRGGMWYQACATLHRIFSHFSYSAMPVIPSLAVRIGIIIELLTVICSCGQVSVSLSWKHVWYRKKNKSYKSRRQFSLDA